MSFTESALSRLKMLIWNGIITHESQTQAKCPSIAKQNLVFSFQFIPPSTTTHTCASLYIHTRIHTYKVCINAYALTQKTHAHSHTCVPTYTYPHIQSIHKCICTYTKKYHTHTHYCTSLLSFRQSSRKLNASIIFSWMSSSFICLFHSNASLATLVIAFLNPRGNTVLSSLPRQQQKNPV